MHLSPSSQPHVPAQPMRASLYLSQHRRHCTRPGGDYANNYSSISANCWPPTFPLCRKRSQPQPKVGGTAATLHQLREHRQHPRVAKQPSTQRHEPGMQLFAQTADQPRHRMSAAPVYPDGQLLTQRRRRRLRLMQLVAQIAVSTDNAYSNLPRRRHMTCAPLLHLQSLSAQAARSLTTPSNAAYAIPQRRGTNGHADGHANSCCTSSVRNHLTVDPGRVAEPAAADPIEGQQDFFDRR